MAECATLIEFLRFAPEFGIVGSKSFGTLTLEDQPSPGDALSIVDPYALPPVSLSLVADTDFDIGVDVAATATNLAAALSGLVIASSVENVITIVSVSSGATSLYTWSSDFGTLEPVAGLGTGAAPGPVSLALESACLQIGSCCYGAKTKLATLYLAGHILATQTGIGSTGAVAKRKIDKIETQYQTTGVPSDKDLGATKYGKLLLAMKKTVFVPPIVGRVGGSRCR